MDERTRLQHEAWSREFWGQLVYVSRSVTRRANEADVLGWHVRLVWGAGRGGIVYLHENRPEAFARGEMMRYVFTDFDAREEARHLVDEIVNHRFAVAA